MNKVAEFFKSNLGFLIGLIVGIVFVLCGLSYFVLNIAIMIGCGLCGRYYQNHKPKVKETLKAWIDKM